LRGDKRFDKIVAAAKAASNNINLALAQVGVIKIVRVGDPRPNGKASQFRYLLHVAEQKWRDRNCCLSHSTRARAWNLAQEDIIGIFSVQK
jgi:hypothetical protein